MLRWMIPSALVLALMMAVWPSAVHADEPPSVHSVSTGLMCQCGCGMTVAACGESMECSLADSMMQEIKVQIDEGKSKGEILDSFVSVYGEQVLAAPRKSGFGLMAWVTPILAVIAGGVAISALVWLWVRRRSTPSEVAVPAAPSGDLHLYEERVDEDLRLLE